MDEFSFEGTLDTVEFALINLVKSYPELYNAQDPSNRDKRKKDLAWAEIAKQLNKDEGWCYAKWKNLSDYYKKRKKIYGNSGSTVTMRRWVYYDALSFLDLYETSRDDSGSVTIVNSSGEHSRSSTEGNQNYFDETQYHSLDGITDRASVKLQHFLEPLVENNSYPQRVKRQRVIAGGNDIRESVSTNRHYHLNVHSDTAPLAPISELVGHTDDDATLQLRIASVQSNAAIKNLANLSSSSTTRNPLMENGSRSCEKVPVHTPPVMAFDKQTDCPHYHFCMSLAARFRQMEPAMATFMQMKIMELILKTEFPEEYNRRSTVLNNQ